MPIKSDIDYPVPFLTSFVPYTEPALEENINNMFSYSIKENAQPVLVEYFVGSPDRLVYTLEISNLLQNASLEFEMLYNQSVFQIDAGITPTISASGKASIKNLLSPLQNKTFNILLTPLITNTATALSAVTDNIQLVVSLVPMGDVVKKSNKTPLTQTTLPSTIQIV